MKVAKWGNSLAVRLPASLVAELGLSEGDQIDLIRNPEGVFSVSLRDFDERRRDAIEWMRPPGQSGLNINPAMLMSFLDGSEESNRQSEAESDRA